MRWIAVILSILCAGCTVSNEPVTYKVKGQVVEFRGTHAIVVAHDPIQDFMGHMTMAFTAADSTELEELAQGDSIAFRWIFGNQVTWIEDIERFYEAERALADTATTIHKHVEN